MEKHFYKKIYNITLSNFWHRRYSWPNTQYIQTLAIEDLYILRYWRSRFFTFVFFIQKLTGISSGKNNKSCRIFHHKSNKIGFTFFWFSVIFYAIYKNQQTHFTILVALLQVGPQKDPGFCNVAPGRGQRRSGGNSGRGSPGSGRGRVGEWPMDH
jgi:hypothetical protein